MWELIAPGGDVVYLMARYPKTQHRIIATLVSGQAEAWTRYRVDLANVSADDITC